MDYQEPNKFQQEIIYNYRKENEPVDNPEHSEGENYVRQFRNYYASSPSASVTTLLWK